jgi:membrane-bound lytic murein transglycosylase D
MAAASDEKAAQTESTSDAAPSKPAAPAPANAAFQTTLTPDQLYDGGKSLFEQYAPAEIKEQYDFPTKEQWNEFAVKLQRALDGDSFEDLAAYEPEARAALIKLRAGFAAEGVPPEFAWMSAFSNLVEDPNRRPAKASKARRPRAPRS